MLPPNFKARRLLLAVSLVLVAIGLIALAVLSPGPQITVGLYVLTGNAWKRIETPTHVNIVQISTADNGDLWLRDANGHILRRHAEDWAASGLPDQDTYTGMVIAGNTFWGFTTQQVVLRDADGTIFRWPFDSPPQSIDAADQPPHAIVVTQDGKLAEISVGGATIQTPPAKLLPSYAPPSAKLTLAHTGSTRWLLHGDLWRNDSGVWSRAWPISLASRSYYLFLAADESSLWMQTEVGLGRIDTGNQLELYAIPREYGDSFKIYAATAHAGVLWMGTSAGVLTFEYGNWTRALPVPAGNAVTALAFDRSDRVWIYAANPA
jgi:ligand-binding sensor domain-containing protein